MCSGEGPGSSNLEPAPLELLLRGLMENNRVYLQNTEHTAILPKVGPAACHSEGNEEARLVERKVCFILDASTWGGGRMDLLITHGQSFYRQREGAISRNSTVSSDSHLEICHQWSDQCHLFCFNL